MISVAQIRSTSNVAANLASCQRLIKQASLNGSKMLFLPEASDFIGINGEETIQLCQSHSAKFIQSVQTAARDFKIWISIGVHEPSSSLSKFYNSNLVINSMGDIVASYQKIHLFDIDIKDGPQLKESNFTIPGHQLAAPIATPMGMLGLAICYDLRFPEQSLLLRSQGAQILCYPSAFTIKTGSAHWETLLRARAIETQSYVVASAQIGKHNDKRESFGHACIIDPWGTVIAQCPDQCDTLVSANVDLSFLEKIRREMPIDVHRRRDLYSLSKV